MQPWRAKRQKFHDTTCTHACTCACKGNRMIIITKPIYPWQLEARNCVRGTGLNAPELVCIMLQYWILKNWTLRSLGYESICIFPHPNMIPKAVTDVTGFFCKCLKRSTFFSNNKYFPFCVIHSCLVLKQKHHLSNCSHFECYWKGLRMSHIFIENKVSLRDRLFNSIYYL